MTGSPIKSELREQLEGKLRFLNNATWEDRINGKLVREWVGQFGESDTVEDDEQIHALFLLSHFLYFGQLEGAVRGVVGIEGGVVSGC